MEEQTPEEAVDSTNRFIRGFAEQVVASLYDAIIEALEDIVEDFKAYIQTLDITPIIGENEDA
jgi:hypothetical protein